MVAAIVGVVASVLAARHVPVTPELRTVLGAVVTFLLALWARSRVRPS